MRHFMRAVRLAAILAGCALFTPVFAQLFFSDIRAGDRDARPITDSACDQLMEGFPDGNFHPEAPLHQGEEVMVMSRLLNIALKGFLVMPVAADPMPNNMYKPWLSSAASFLAENGLWHAVIGHECRPDRQVSKGAFLQALYALMCGATSGTPQAAYAWCSDASLLPEGWGDDQHASVSRRQAACVLEAALYYLTQHAVTEGKIVKYDMDDDQNRWVTLDTPLGQGRLVLPPEGVTIHGGQATDLQPGRRIHTLSDAVTGKAQPYYRVREVTIVD